MFIRFGAKLHRKILRLSMGAPLVTDLFLFRYGRDFMMSLSDDTHADNIEAFNSTSRYLDDLLNSNTPNFEGMVTKIYPTELQLNIDNSTDSKKR